MGLSLTQSLILVKSSRKQEERKITYFVRESWWGHEYSHYAIVNTLWCLRPSLIVTKLTSEEVARRLLYHIPMFRASARLR